MAGNNFRKYVLIFYFLTLLSYGFCNSRIPSITAYNLANAKYTLEEFFLYGSAFYSSDGKYFNNSINQENAIYEQINTDSIENIIDINYNISRIEIQQSIPLIKNSYVDNYIKFMSESKLDFIKSSVKRGTPYINEMMEIFESEGLPKELVYLPIIESGFKNHAYSKAKAVGMWQFIPGTAKWIGMNINSWIDERRDPIISCRYAAKFLKFLYDKFEDWYLVLAAYNHGGFNIKKELKSIGSQEYYDLVKTKATPAETRGYVPSLIAVLYMLKHNEQYGIELPDGDFSKEYDYVGIPFMVQSNLIAKYSDITIAEFNNLNPALTLGFTPEKKYDYKVRIPKNKKQILVNNMEKLKSNSYSNYIPYYVKSGDSLSGIAYKYGVSINVIMKINNITNANKIRINQRIFIPKNV